jgi:hypothetical protein
LPSGPFTCANEHGRERDDDARIANGGGAPISSRALTGASLPVDLLATTNGGATWQPQVVDGLGGGHVLSTATADYFAGVGVPPGNPYTSLFVTHTGGASPKPTDFVIDSSGNGSYGGAQGSVRLTVK